MKLLDRVCRLEKALKNTHIKFNRSPFSRNITGNDAYNVRRYSPLTWFPGEREDLHVSTFYRTAAHFVSPKTFKISEDLGNLVWLDLNKNRWGRNISSIIRDDNVNTALLPYLDRINKEVRKEVRESIPTILDLLPPAKFGGFEDGYRCNKISLSQWATRELGKHPLNIDQRKVESVTTFGIESNGDPFSLDDSQFFIIRYFIPRATTTPNDVREMVKYVLNIAANGLLIGVNVYDQQFFPLFGRDEYVICIKISDVEKFYSLHK